VTPLVVVMRKEIRDAVRSRWLLAFAATFAVIALALSLVESRGGDLGSQGFNRTTAGLINLCLLLVPLLSLVLGAGAIAGERERGTLTSLLAQPLTPAELLLGKWLGLAIAIWMAIVLGFGASGLVMALVQPLTDIGHYALFVVLSATLAAAMLSLGMLVSVVSGGRVKALAGAIVLWFVLVLFYDLGAIGLALTISSSGRALLLVVLGNPVETVRILAVLSLEPDLQVLGPLGAYVVEEVGTGVGLVLLIGALVTWTVAPLVVAVQILGDQDA
jgi:Cu-processing system permease protein